jgi:hypothetical protein
MIDDTIPPFSFPAVRSKKITAAFDGRSLSSEGGVMRLAQAERLNATGLEGLRSATPPQALRPKALRRFSIRYSLAVVADREWPETLTVQRLWRCSGSKGVRAKGDVACRSVRARDPGRDHSQLETWGALDRDSFMLCSTEH